MRGDGRVVAFAVASLLVQCGGASIDPSSSRSALTSSATGNPAGGNKPLTVMTRNLYLGADLTPVLVAVASGSNLVAATSGAWAKVQITNFSLRAIALAEEIAATQPDVIGLQEVFLWRVGPPDSLLPGGGIPATTVVYDFLETLRAELASRGLDYHLASATEHLDMELPAVDLLRGAAPTQFLIDVRATDRDVILTRADLHTAHPSSGQFRLQNLAPIPGTHRFILRGWASVEVKFHGEWLRLVDTHTETSAAGKGVFNALQISELVDMLAGEPLPVVVLGDLNAPGALAEDSGSPGYRDLIERGGFSDSWHALHPDEPGFSCCRSETLTALASRLHERIDYVLFRGPISPRAATLVGVDGSEMVGGLWPSDHAGVVGVLRLENARFASGR
jgi:endonuclease/exonuclease/phosphatase family metal-dependent hydrolase